MFRWLKLTGRSKQQINHKGNFSKYEMEVHLSDVKAKNVAICYLALIIKENSWSGRVWQWLYTVCGGVRERHKIIFGQSESSEEVEQPCLSPGKHGALMGSWTIHQNNNDRNDDQILIKEQNHWENVTSVLNSAPATPRCSTVDAHTHLRYSLSHSLAHLPNHLQIMFF